MADTIRAEQPEVICDDCKEKGNVCFSHWGPLVPAGKSGNFCPSCMNERREYLNEHGTAKPLEKTEFRPKTPAEIAMARFAEKKELLRKMH